MKKFFATAGAVAVLALTASPAQAASQASASARVYRPLVLSSDQNLDFGIIVLSGASFSGESVAMNNSGTVTSCGTGAGNLTCSGNTQPARYTVVGAANQDVKVTAPSFTLSPVAAGLTVTPNVVGVSNVVNTGASGNSTGVTFTMGAKLDGLANTTPDGTYSGNFNVTVNYN